MAVLLVKDPEQGTSLGKGMYKVRLAVKRKAKGKSGGARVITYLVTANKEVFLLTIYDKSEQDTIDTKSLMAVVADIEAVKKR